MARYGCWPELCVLMRAAFKALKAFKKPLGADTSVPANGSTAYALSYQSPTVAEQTYSPNPNNWGRWFYFDLLTGGTASIADLVKTSAYKALHNSAGVKIAETAVTNPVSPLVKTGLVPGRYYVYDETANGSVYDFHIQVTLSAGATFDS